MATFNSGANPITVDVFLPAAVRGRSAGGLSRRPVHLGGNDEVQLANAN